MTLPDPVQRPDPNIDEPPLPPVTPEDEPGDSPTPPVGDPPSGEPPVHA